MESKWVFIVNPAAGSGFPEKYTATLREKIDSFKISAEIVITERAGHATELATEYADKGFKYIVAVGGDGKLNEIARSLVGKKDCVLGIVPAGTGNDFIQILGFPDRFNQRHTGRNRLLYKYHYHRWQLRRWATRYV